MTGTADGASADLAIGAFTENGPWVVEPDAMPWRAGIDVLRQRTQAMVPALIDRRRVPVARLAVVGGRIVAAVVPWAINKRLGKQQDSRTQFARRLRGAFERLGCTYIKMGQIIASAEGMLPAELVAEFKQCRDRVPPEPFSTVRTLVEAELGAPLAEIFERFDPVPLAAASIAQVHAARLRTGEDVVVKVQRPNLAQTVRDDLRTMAWLAPILVRRVPQLALVNLPAYTELFAETIVEELDFRLEAQNMLDIAAVLARTDQRAVVVPRPHPTLVTPRVLVMERLRGFEIDDDAAMREAGVDPSAVFTSLMVSFFEGAGVYGVFHGDLHGGNMMVLPDGRAAIFDFGITGRFADHARIALMKLLLGGLTNDVNEQIRSFRDLGGFPADADIEAIAAALDVEKLRTMQAELSPEQMADQMRELIKQLLDQGARLPKSLFLFMKGMIYLNGAIAALAADVNILETLAKVFTHFSTVHGALFASDFGVDLGTIDFEQTMQTQMQEQMGVDVSGGISYREMNEIQTKRLEEMRNQQG
jgi:ubiquinone biosynthesis protein